MELAEEMAKREGKNIATGCQLHYVLLSKNLDVLKWWVALGGINFIFIF
jgi:hypothetical protein